MTVMLTGGFIGQVVGKVENGIATILYRSETTGIFCRKTGTIKEILVNETF